ncbi:MAG: hypothetical protein JXA10_15290 [Anaerolineae bacterium]|nr:hypothetical protein [Anaerolineae bacterium]
MQSHQQASVRTGYVAADFMTATYRVSGEVALRGVPLLDQLNDHQALFLTLERVFVSPLLDPAVLTGNYKYAELRKNSIGIVVLTMERDGLPHREGRYKGRDHRDHEVMFVTTGFEIVGSLRLHPSVNIPNFVRTTPEHFIPLFNARATLTGRRDVVFEGGAILLNRNGIEVFALADR